jgi:hypothetical protein
MKWFFGSLLASLFGLPIYLPWVLARIGIYKRWYLAYSLPPLIWGRAIFMWPVSAVFVCAPFIGLIPVGSDEKGTIWAIVSVAGVILAVIMVIWTPSWAKPKWQRYLEDCYSRAEIRTFILVWREMDRRTWGELLDSEEGIEELVAIARKARKRR